MADTTKRIIIIGAGGHGQVVADILWQMHAAGLPVRPTGFLDENSALHGQVFLDLPVLGRLADLPAVPHEAVVVAVGDNQVRQRLFLALAGQGEQFQTACHPRATIARDVTIGAGSMICAAVVINTGSRIGQNVILNTGCTIDHHNQIGDHVHIAPGAHLGGEVTVAELALVGIGATVLPRRHIAALSIVGGGAVVTRDIPAGSIVVGVPARPVEK